MEKNPNNQNQSMIKKCPMCGREYPKKQRACEKCHVVLVREKDYEKLKITKNLNTIPNEHNIPKCPKCGSTAVSTGARGFSMVTGFIGAGQTVNRCGNCGNTWKQKG